MNIDFQETQRMLSTDRRLRSFSLRREGAEFHLERAGDIFIRLLPHGEKSWHLEVYRSDQGWERVDMVGTFEECLSYLAEHRPYQH